MNTVPPRQTVHSVRPFFVVWSIYFFAVLLGVKFLLFPSGLTERMDFRQLYAGGFLIWNEPKSLYDLGRQKVVEDVLVSKAEGFLLYNHPPYEALLFSGFSRLRFRTAYVAFLCANMILLAACLVISKDALSRPGTVAQPRAGLQIFLFFPVAVALLLGQDSVIFLFGLSAIYRWLKARRYFQAGLILGVLLFKPQFAVPLAIFSIARYGVAMLLGFVAGSAIALFISIAAVGWTAFSSFGKLLFLTGSANFEGPSNPLGVSLTTPNLKGLMLALMPREVSPLWTAAAILGVSVLFSLWVIRKIRIRRLTDEAAFSLAIASAAMVSFHLHIYDLTAMLLPLGLTANSRNRLLQISSWLLYAAPPVLIYIAHGSLVLLSLVLMIFVYAVAEYPESLNAESSLDGR